MDTTRSAPVTTLSGGMGLRAGEKDVSPVMAVAVTAVAVVVALVEHRRGSSSVLLFKISPRSQNIRPRRKERTLATPKCVTASIDNNTSPRTQGCGTDGCCALITAQRAPRVACQMPMFRGEMLHRMAWKSHGFLSVSR